ncbi:GNAT family N-acetyltransferase [Tunicatimonas pelagia]|uniref:GNAT family N-acetyltransferase n=1 Tax=Tunicatimonas pelagia TaxID=931531 RepID=UPI0026655004|nr:GNAT family N-acetyltransferase [Tunicatimonas pelagia]WKN44023.1 GNAT family N-acetyltransferase [Tunicatimonas pelagia]
MMMVRKVSTDEELQQAFQIRNEVFVQEQQVAPEEEYDEYDATAAHYLAYDKAKVPCGTARWRKTEQGIKLERFAVLASHRGKGVGAVILRQALIDIDESAWSDQSVYLHAQITAISFYERFGFEKVGDEFEECNIKHFKMIRA